MWFCQCTETWRHSTPTTLRNPWAQRSRAWLRRMRSAATSTVGACRAGARIAAMREIAFAEWFSRGLEQEEIKLHAGIAPARGDASIQNTRVADCIRVLTEAHPTMRTSDTTACRVSDRRPNTDRRSTYGSRSPVRPAGTTSVVKQEARKHDCCYCVERLVMAKHCAGTVSPIASLGYGPVTACPLDCCQLIVERGREP